MTKKKNQNLDVKKQTLRQRFRAGADAIRERVSGLLKRRPHRSFKKTLRRDYSRSLMLPGYWAFTNHVRKTILSNKRLFIGLTLFYGVMTVLLVGVASQDAYLTLTDALKETGSDIFKGGFGEIGKAALLLASGVTGSFNSELTEPQMIYAVLVGLLTWLTAVWLLRGMLSGAKPRLRDGIYSAGSPIVPTMLVMLVLIVQMLPVALAIIGFGSAVSTELIQAGGVEAMLFWMGAVLLLVLSLYWITSTLIALVVVTLPGMYPMQALKVAGDMAVGRRLRLLLRILWLGLTIAIGWALVMLPVVLIDTWIKSVFVATEWVPVVPVAMLMMSSVTIVWASSYVYLLYRKVVDDDSAPA